MTHSDKLREWLRLFSEYAGAQSMIQLLGVLAGLWLVQLLSVREYALYTLALSILTFLAIFSDLGVSSALLYFRRETRIAQTAFAPYIRAALALRRALLAFGCVAGIAFMAVVGRARGFGSWELAIIAAVLMAAVWIQVSASTALLQLRLEGLYRESYLAELLGNALRLFGVAAMWLASVPLAGVAMLTSAVGSLATSISASRNVRRTDQAPLAKPVISGATPMNGIVRYVLPMSLSAAYFSIQGPLTVWLSAFFAGMQSIAEVGALGRLGAIFGLLSGFMGTVLIPRLSAITDDAHYLRRHLQSWTLLAAFGAALIALAWFLPQWLLLLLGDAYSELSDGVLLIVTSAVLSTWGGYLVGINNARGWVRRQPVALAMFAATQVALIATLDLSSTVGVLYFGLWSNVAGLILQTAINATGFMKPALVALRR